MFIVTEKKEKYAVFSATEKQVNDFLTNPDLAINANVFTIGEPHDLDVNMTSKQIVALYNQLTNSELVKFQSKNDGVERVFPLLKDKAAEYDQLVSKKTAAPVKRKAKGTINLEPHKTVFACRQGSKQALLVDALKNGATIEMLLKVCSAANGGKKSWSEESVRSGVYWDVNKVKGYGIRTEFLKDGTPKYFLTYPPGMDAPLPNTPVRSSVK